MLHTPIRALALTVLMLIVGSFTACSASPSSGGSHANSSSPQSGGYATITDACMLASASEIASIIGETVTPSTLDFHGVPSCKYSDTAHGYVQTSVDVEQSAQNAQSLYQSGKGPDAMTVSGVGDAAAYDGIATLTVLKGNAVLGITVLISTVADPLAAEKHIALLLISHLH